MTYRYRRRSHRFLLLLWCLPLLLFFLLPGEKEYPVSAEATDNSSSSTSAEERRITLERTDGSTVTLPLEDYVCGVIAAEMPSSFHSEALKAQAVIARTYALWKIDAAPDSHGNAELCDQPGHCQAYEDKATLRAKWGTDFEEKYKRICNAAEETAGEVLIYHDDLAEAYYHSTCGGRTASAKEVWGEEVPYLQSVSCKWDHDAPRYQQTVTVALSELPWLLGDGISPCITVAEGESASYVPKVTSKTESGRIGTVSYAGLLFDAIDFRTALKLNSTNFRFSSDQDTLTVTTCGFGHGVGLCQYGANGMAENGKSYREILKHYYQKINIENR